MQVGDPFHGSHEVARCERIRDIDWQVLRVSLRPISQQDSAGLVSTPIADRHP